MITIGHQVLENLLGRGEPDGVIVRDPSGLPPRTRERVEVVQGSPGDFHVVDRTFAGADAVFWLVPPTLAPNASRPPMSTSPGRFATLPLIHKEGIG